MLGALKDRLKGAIYGGRLGWQDIVDTFKLRYPTVSVSTRGLEGVPGAFIVWRSEDGTYWIDLTDSKEKALRWIQGVADVFGDADLRRIAGEEWQNRQYVSLQDLRARKERPDSTGRILNWGLFDYDCKAGLAEFTATGRSHNGGFVGTFVLNADKEHFRHYPVSR